MLTRHGGISDRPAGAAGSAGAFRAFRATPRRATANTLFVEDKLDNPIGVLCFSGSSETLLVLDKHTCFKPATG
jgi:hypothetical protein